MFFFLDVTRGVDGIFDVGILVKLKFDTLFGGFIDVDVIFMY